MRNLFCYWLKNKWFVRNDRNGTECCAYVKSKKANKHV